MPSAIGPLSGNFNGFTGHWNVEGYEVELRGNFSESVEHWQSSATLEYNDVQDLSGTFNVNESHVGNADTSLSFTNPAGKRIKVTGHLSSPISQRTFVNGHGSWSITM